MERMNLNHWFIDENELSIALVRWHVTIKPGNNDVELIIHYDSQVVSTLRFNNYEEAVVFTEDIINECHEVDEIVEKYYEIKHNKPKTRKKTK